MPSNMGNDGFAWFVGVVEDRHDPEKLGRIRVRALGTHTQNKARIPTADLPWAHVMQPVTGNAIAGIGDSPTNLIEGTWVVGFFRDPDSRQELVIIGTLPGMNVTGAEADRPQGARNRGAGSTALDYSWGFFDPSTPADLAEAPFEPDPTTYVPAAGTPGKVIDIVSPASDKVLSYKEVSNPKTTLPTGAFLKTKDATIGTHSQGLTDTFTTTRRLTVDVASLEVGVKTLDPPLTALVRGSISPAIVSPGYLEDTITRDADGAAYWPVTRDLLDASRIPHPRISAVLKSSLTTTQETEIKALFEEGVYGTATWDAVKASQYVVLPKADVNRLAQGGYKIKSIMNGATVIITLDAYTIKPKLAAKDTIQLSGIIGLEGLNGPLFPLKSASLGTTSGTLIIDRPASVSETQLYISGGVVLVNPHPVLRDKADVRERQINVGAPGVGTGIFAAKWNQPTSRYAAQYPYNKVFESESGHIKEYDDTPGAERIHEYHRSGTYYEIDQNGMKVDYVKGDNYNIRIHDDYLYVKGDIVWTGDNQVMIRGNDDMSLSSKWRMKVWSGGDVEIYSQRDIKMRAEGDIQMLAGGNIHIEGEVTSKAHENIGFAAGTRPADTISHVVIKSGKITEDAPKIDDGGGIYMNPTTQPDSITIAAPADTPVTGTTGQGAGLGIDTVGDNIRNLTKND